MTESLLAIQLEGETITPKPGSANAGVSDTSTGVCEVQLGRIMGPNGLNTFCMLVSSLYSQPFGSLLQDTIGQEVYKQQTFISQGPGGWKSKMKALADSVPGEGWCPGS